MPETQYSTTARLRVETIWDFVKDMDNWAPLLTGYQTHTKESETDSVWTLKGDVGALARTVKFRAHVTEWAGPDRVSFELVGLNEQMEGGGSFRIQAYEDESAVVESGAPRGPLGRLIDAIVRFFFRLRHGKVERGESATAGPGRGMARMTFTLRIDPGGPMAPMISAMMKPAMRVAVEDLSNKIVAHLEDKQTGNAQAAGQR